MAPGYKSTKSVSKSCDRITKQDIRDEIDRRYRQVLEDNNIEREERHVFIKDVPKEIKLTEVKRPVIIYCCEV